MLMVRDISKDNSPRRGVTGGGAPGLMDCQEVIMLVCRWAGDKLYQVRKAENIVKYGD